MRLNHSSWMLFASLTLASMSSAQAGPAPASAPAGDFRALLGVAARAAEGVAVAQEQRTALEKDADIFFRDQRIHNATGCTYPEGHSETCAAYAAAKTALDNRQRVLIGREKATSEKLIIARSRLNMAMSKLRIVSILGELEPWRRQVVNCSKLPSERSAAACLKEAWEKVPPIRPATM